MSTAQTERNSLRVMGLAGFASMASMRLCDPMLVVLGQEFHVTTGEASRVVSAFAVAYHAMLCVMEVDTHGHQRGHSQRGKAPREGVTAEQTGRHTLRDGPGAKGMRRRGHG